MATWILNGKRDYNPIPPTHKLGALSTNSPNSSPDVSSFYLVYLGLFSELGIPGPVCHPTHPTSLPLPHLPQPCPPHCFTITVADSHLHSRLTALPKLFPFMTRSHVTPRDSQYIILYCLTHYFSSTKIEGLWHLLKNCFMKVLIAFTNLSHSLN